MSRITDAQFHAVEWINENIPENATMHLIGTISYPKYRWIHMLSHKPFTGGFNLPPDEAGKKVEGTPMQNLSYLIIDYSDFTAIGNKDALASLSQFETQVSATSAKVYDRENIKVYKLGKQ